VIYHLSTPVAVILLLLPLIVHRIHLYRVWVERERSQGRKPGIIAFGHTWERWRDPVVFFKDRRNQVIAVAWLVLMFFPFHRL